MIAICSVACLLALVVLAPLTYLRLPRNLQGGAVVLDLTPESTDGPPLELFDQRPVGMPFIEPPRISYLEVVDLDQDGLLDILVCDCRNDFVSWIRQTEQGEFVEQMIAENLIAPARLTCVDFDGDGDLDIFVAVLGQLFPTNEKIGSLIALENLGNQEFAVHELLSGVARVSDVRVADLDGDGLLDLVVTQFGYDDGELRWMKNLENWQFESHTLQSLSGGIHGVVADMNQDQHPDIVALISQQYEEIYVFYGDGQGNFEETRVFAAGNPDFGSSGISAHDLDGDGDLDILYTNGDAFDYSPPRPWPWHGVQWLENLDGYRFRYRRLANLGGAVNAQPLDIDGNGELDILVSSVFNDWETPESQSLMLLKNSGNMNFVKHPLGNSPSHIQAFAVADLNADGKMDVVTGGMHISEPYDRVERIMVWYGK